jgi:hypothetical protein
MNSKISTKAVCILVVMFCFSSVSMAYDLYCDYFNAYFDDAGYSDVINWGGYPTNTNHPYSFHETLSGEWGVAISYDDISMEPNAMWLPSQFVFPTWTTNSTFSTSSSLSSRDDPNNPVVGYDTAQSKIVSEDRRN